MAACAVVNEIEMSHVIFVLKDVAYMDSVEKNDGLHAVVLVDLSQRQGKDCQSF